MEKARQYPALMLALLLAAGPAQAAGPIPLPSGVQATLLEVVRDAAGPLGLTWRFRYLAPQIDSGAYLTQSLADMTYLCTHEALPVMPTMGPVPRQIVISMAQTDIAFGTVDPGVVQLFEAFVPSDGFCEWQVF